MTDWVLDSAGVTSGAARVMGVGGMGLGVVLGGIVGLLYGHYCIRMIKRM